MSSILNILDQFSSYLFSMCLERKSSTLQYKLLHLFLEFFTILKDSTKLPMFMFSADSQCLSKELWSTVSTIGSSMPYSTPLNSTCSHQDITTLLLVLQDFVELGLSSSSLTTNAIRFWVISDEVQRKRPIKSTKMLQKQEKFHMDMALALFPAQTISGKLLDGWLTPCWPETTLPTYSQYFQWFRWLSGHSRSTADTKNNLETSTQKVVKQCSLSSYDSQHDKSNSLHDYKTNTSKCESR